jgi:hypothetical protein
MPDHCSLHFDFQELELYLGQYNVYPNSSLGLALV